MNNFVINCSNVKDISFLTKDFESNPLEITYNSLSQISIPVKSFGENVLISGQLIFQGPPNDSNPSINTTSTIKLNLLKSSINESPIQTIIVPSLSEDEMRIINIYTSYKNINIGYPYILNHIITFETSQQNQVAFLKGYTLSFTQVDDNNIVKQTAVC